MISSRTDPRIGPAPCKDCAQREPGCHTRCTNYIEWSERNRRIKEDDYQKRTEYARVTGYLVEASRKRRKEYHR